MYDDYNGEDIGHAYAMKEFEAQNFETESSDAKALNDLASQVIKALHAHGVIIHRYDAYSTDSIYLKLDYGLANTIRISNHSGKRQLAYRFNLILNKTKKTTKINKYPMYFYPPSMVETMISDILASRDAKRNKYSITGYCKIMNDIKNGEKPKGFWSGARLLER